MRQSIAFRNAALAFLALLAAFAADVRAVTIDFVPVGNPSNAADTTQMTDGTVGYGSVAYNYNIARYDVTVGQYTAFLNAVAATDPYGLYTGGMAMNGNVAGIAQSGSSGSYTYSVIGSANHPIAETNWGSAARFANWIQNGQPTGAEEPGTTETGAYTLDGATTDAALYHIARNAGATIFLPSENEWYKAAFYNPLTSSYYQYPFSSNTPPTSAMPGSTPNTGNFASSTSGFAVTHSQALNPSQNYLTDVGAYTASASPYGAFDMGGEVFQWNDNLLTGPLPRRIFRGSSWANVSSQLKSMFRPTSPPSITSSTQGFRLASASIPEPSSLVLAALGFIALAAWGWRRRKCHGPL